MTPYFLYESAKAAINQAVLERKDRLARGHWKTESEARKLVGEVVGLECARDLLLSELQKIEKLEDDE